MGDALHSRDAKTDISSVNAAAVSLEQTPKN